MILLTAILIIISILLVLKNIKITHLTYKDLLKLSLPLVTVCLIEYFFIPNISILLMVISIFIYQLLILKEKFFKVLISSLIVPILIILCDFIIGHSFMSIFNFSYLDIRDSVYIQFIIGVLILILSYFLSKFIGYLISKNSTLFTNNKASKKLLGILGINIISAFLVMYFFVFYLRTIVSSNVYVNFITIVSVIYALSSFVAILFYGMYIKKDIELTQKNNETKQLQEYTNMIEYMYTDIRKFKHDYVNLLSSINGYLEMNQLKELKDFFTKEILPMSDSIDKDSMKLVSLHNLNCIPLKGLLSSKLLLAQNNNLDVLIDMIEPIDISEDSIAVLDLCRIIGILIDNALEAASETDKRLIRVALVNKNNSVIVLILNSINADVPPIQKMFKKGYSTKGKNRGIGLSTVNSIVKSYDNITLNTMIEASTFVQELTIIQEN